MAELYRREAIFGEVARVLVGAFALLCAGGCSVTPSSDSRADVTGSIGRDPVTTLSADLGQEDWRRAKGALATALDPQGSGAAVKWDNPDSDINGTFTPVAQPFVKADEICRVFLATINFPGRTSSLQGTACKLSADEWQLKDVKPWRKPS